MKRSLLFAIALFVIGQFASAAESQSELRPWDEYHTILWMSDKAYKDPAKIPLVFQRLKEMGINTAMVHGDADFRPATENKFHYYVENIVNRGLCLKFSSKVTDWDKFVTEWAKNGRSEDALKRDYCLDDPEWLNWAKREMQTVARKNKVNAPIAFDIRDELSTTISANPFDYDFNPQALNGFRAWLKTQYADLAALNAEWDTHFASWDDVKPFTTDQIKNRMAGGAPGEKPDFRAVQQIKFDPTKALEEPARWNFAPWADFRTYMDISLVRTLNALRGAAHEIDPQTPIGIEGTQMPSAFGGYDLWRLSRALDWVEPYDIGSAREIFGSFMANAPFMTTVFEKTTESARRRLWHLLLEGDRGCLVWWSDDCIDWKNPDYALTDKAKALAPVLKELSSPLARYYLRAQRVYDPIFIHYSQPSIQADWLIESTADGASWTRRFSSFEADHNHMTKVRTAWLKAYQDLGFSPQFISSEQIEKGMLRNFKVGCVVLPTSLAISEKEMRELKDFSGRSQRIAADATPGVFDEHGRLRTREQLAALAIRTNLPTVTSAEAEQYLKDRLAGDASTRFSNYAKNILPDMPAPDLIVTRSAHARVHRFRLGLARLVAIERNINYQMSEDLKQAGGNETLEQTGEVSAYIGRPKHVYNLRTDTYLGEVRAINFTLDPWQPSLYALLDHKVDSIWKFLDEQKN
jgi:hypothetical protein